MPKDRILGPQPKKRENPPKKTKPLSNYAPPPFLSPNGFWGPQINPTPGRGLPWRIMITKQEPDPKTLVFKKSTKTSLGFFLDGYQGRRWVSLLSIETLLLQILAKLSQMTSIFAQWQQITICVAYRPFRGNLASPRLTRL